MGRTSYASWDCDFCDLTFIPSQSQRKRRDGPVACRNAECQARLNAASKGYAAPMAEPVAPVPYERTKPRGGPRDPLTIGTKRFLVISDIHAPFHHEAALDRALSETADACFVNGDITDSYSFSPWLKYENVTWDQEWDAVSHITKRICDRYADVRMVMGNHDERLAKRLAEEIPVGWMEWIKKKVGRLDPLAVLAEEYPNLKLSSRDVDGHNVAWFDQIGDVIFSHAEEYSAAETNSVARKVETYYRNFSEVLGLDPFSLIVQSHTHDLSWVPIGGRSLVVQSGCLCKTHGYQLRPRKLPNRPQQLGYVTFTMHDGKVDIATVHAHWVR